jgi:hypothetical protein
MRFIWYAYECVTDDPDAEATEIARNIEGQVGVSETQPEGALTGGRSGP